MEARKSLPTFDPSKASFKFGRGYGETSKVSRRRGRSSRKSRTSRHASPESVLLFYLRLLLIFSVVFEGFITIAGSLGD